MYLSELATPSLSFPLEHFGEPAVRFSQIVFKIVTAPSCQYVLRQLISNRGQQIMAYQPELTHCSSFK